MITGVAFDEERLIGMTIASKESIINFKKLKSIRQESPEVFQAMRWFSKWAKKLESPQVLAFPVWQQDILAQQIAKTAQRLDPSYPVSSFTVPIKRKNGICYITMFSKLDITSYEFKTAQAGIMISAQNPDKTLQAKMIGADFLTVYTRTLAAIKGFRPPPVRRRAVHSAVPLVISTMPPAAAIPIATALGAAA